MVSTVSSVLDRFGPAARAWFRDTFAEPTRAQELGWDAISRGEHTLLCAPTGSGKTLAAFLWCLDNLATRSPAAAEKSKARTEQQGVSVLYISPLKALSYDIERNLRAPLAGLRIAAVREGLPEPEISVATRTGDTPLREREHIRKNPPDILITTPESLYLLLTSRSREALRNVETVIVDEIHTMAATKRGAHLALSLERLERLCERPPQRIGLSATQRPLEEVAKYLGGDRPVTIADAGVARELDLQIVVPIERMDHPAEFLPGEGDPEARSSIWPAVYPELLDLVRAHRSTLIFVNNRRLAERIAARINDLAGEELLRAHHGSVSREQRLDIEDRLKAGEIPGLVCTSSLELGIDMGAVDLVIQVESPKSVARGMQRVGRAGHQVGAPSVGRIFPKFRGDLLECAVVADRMRGGLIERTEVPKNPLDVLAQQVVAMCAVEDLSIAEIEQLAHRTYSFGGLTRDALESVLGMLAGQYPSDEFADLKPRVTWDRTTDIVSSRRDAKTIALVNAGTIPDRGMFGVFLGQGGPRVGELDEEMVYETRPGETFLLGATSWRVEQITRDQVIVSPAPGQPGKMPFWKGDGVGRPLELGQAIGKFTREIGGIRAETQAVARLVDDHLLDERAATNLVAYLTDEREATGALPTDRTIVVQRFRDELGDWRIVLLTPFGGRVHAPWAQAIEARLAEQSGFDVQTIWSDDGIAIRFANGEDLPSSDLLFPAPEQVEELVIDRLASSALFASHFRENAGRALLLPKRRPGARSPLWLQRQRSANLLAVASRYGSFPIVLETYRECLRDVFDLPGLVEVLTRIRSRDIRIHEAETREASPFARGLLFDYVAAYMYEGDAPLAERRAQALTLDRDLLRDLLGEDELRELLDPEAVETIELELQALAPNRQARNPDQLHDLLRRLGDLSGEELAARVTEPHRLDEWLTLLESSHRACLVRLAGGERWIAIEDAGRYRDALGVAPPLGVPEVFLQPGELPLDGLVARYARTHAPFLAHDAATRWAVPESLIRSALDRLAVRGLVLHGDFRPGGVEREWCDPEVLRMLRRRSLARLRREVEPVGQAAFARFLARWQGIGSESNGIDRLRDAVAQLEGQRLPASVLEREILPARVADYQPRLLDELGASGEVAWAGASTLGKDDGRILLARRDRLGDLIGNNGSPPLLMPQEKGSGGDGDPADKHGAPALPADPTAAILQTLRTRGASFFSDLLAATGAGTRDTLEALWELVWAGQVTNDTFAPLRALAWPKRGGTSPRQRLSAFPPESAGRWSLVPEPVSTPTVQAHTLATLLLERYGIVTREAVVAEGIPGGFSAVYPVLKAMEDAGRVRRGYFVEGLGAAQFALPGAVDRLRAERDAPEEPLVMVLAASDPANPYGAAIAWPRRDDDGRHPFQRAAGARVILVDGEPALFLDRGGRSVATFPAFEGATGDIAIAALFKDAASQDRARPIERVDGEPVADSPCVGRFLAAGFVRGYRGLTTPGVSHARR